MFGLNIFGSKQQETQTIENSIREMGEFESDDYENDKLYEIKTVQQDDPVFVKRWFTTDTGNVNLYIWESKTLQSVKRFDFYYEIFSEEKMIRWQSDRDWQFATVDTDDDHKLYKSSAVLQFTDDVNLQEALQIFCNYATMLDESIYAFIETQFTKHSAMD